MKTTSNNNKKIKMTSKKKSTSKINENKDNLKNKMKIKKTT